MLLHPNSPLFRWVGYTVDRIQVLPTHLGYLVMNVLVTSITEGNEKTKVVGINAKNQLLVIHHCHSLGKVSETGQENFKEFCVKSGNSKFYFKSFLVGKDNIV